LAGCHRAHPKQLAKAARVSTARMAPPFSPRSRSKARKEFMVVYLVRSSRTYARIRSLTTGTFNLVVKDRIAFRLSGAPSGLDGLATRANPAVLETLQTYSPRKTLSIRASHSISTRFPHWERRLGRAGELRRREADSSPGFSARFGMTDAFRGGGSLQRATVWPSAWDYKPD